MLHLLKALADAITGKNRVSLPPPANLISITPDQFSAVVLAAKLPVVVDFFAPWCPPCNALAPVLENVARAFEGRILVVKIDTEANDTRELRYELGGDNTAIPALMFFHNGELVKDHRGFLREKPLTALFQSVLDSLSAPPA